MSALSQSILDLALMYLKYDPNYNYGSDDEDDGGAMVNIVTSQ